MAVSIETRKERGEEYSAFKGSFKQFELAYVIADERDLIGLRTNHRGEDVYLYPMQITLDEGLAATVAWYGENQEWWTRVKSGEYREYYDRMYANRGDAGTA